ncbi:MAG: 23S rRNA (pseudouridine(1915)-N(3))-methyltransferase RlmH [Bacteroidales bacterium]|nr:23S rRNA (pseudouridine(1915)-N(3))-methyltransferase RlmH [Bacteroidales bacterium]
MKITLIWIAKTNASYLSEGIKEYTDRLKHYCQFSIVEIPEYKSSSKTSFDEIKKKEGIAILAKLPQNAQSYLLDENGKEYTSRQFAKIIETAKDNSRDLCFVIGGPYGFSQDVYAAVPNMISFSKMTFSHQMIRVFVVEQFYRAFTIINDLPYHHD